MASKFRTVTIPEVQYRTNGDEMVTENTGLMDELSRLFIRRLGGISEELAESTSKVEQLRLNPDRLFPRTAPPHRSQTMSIVVANHIGPPTRDEVQRMLADTLGEARAKEFLDQLVEDAIQILVAQPLFARTGKTCQESVEIFDSFKTWIANFNEQIRERIPDARQKLANVYRLIGEWAPTTEEFLATVSKIESDFKGTLPAAAELRERFEEAQEMLDDWRWTRRQAERLSKFFAEEG